MSIRQFVYWLAATAAPVASVWADQPIMNMMPRWDGGYGFQVLAERLHRSDLKQGIKSSREVLQKM